MAKIEDQNIPAELKDLYDATLRPAADGIVGGRTPFSLPSSQNPPLGNPSAGRAYVRKIFKECAECFGKQPLTGGVEPPAIGPRNRSWWYDNDPGTPPIYYNWFMKQSLDIRFAGGWPDWCKEISTEEDSFVENSNPGINFGGLRYANMLHYEFGGPIRAWGCIKLPDYAKGISLYFSRAPADDTAYPKTIYFHKFLSAWEENTITWNNKPAIGDAEGAITFGSVLSFSYWKTVQLPQSLFGWAIKWSETQSGQNALYFQTKEYPNPAYRPIILV